MFIRYPVYMLVRGRAKNDLSSKCKISNTNNLRITATCHAHLQTLTKTHANLKKDLAKIVGDATKKMTMSKL